MARATDGRLGRSVEMRITRKRRIALGAAALAGIAALAYAYWTGTGSGTGTGDVGTGGSVTLTGTVTDGVAPGTSVPVSFTAANATDSPIRVTTVHLESVSVDAGHSGCNTADFSMADVTQNHQVPGNATAEPLPNNGSLAMANTAVNQDACKNATLTLTLSST
jgi:hypothetical protein